MSDRTQLAQQGVLHHRRWLIGALPYFAYPCDDGHRVMTALPDHSGERLFASAR